MIEINLLPEEKRVKIRKAAAAPGKPAVPVSESLKKLVYVVPAAVGILMVVHAYLAFSQVSLSVALGSLAGKVQSFQPQMKNIAGFKVKFESFTQDEKIMQELAKANINWAEKLNRLSLDLPPGIWISDLSASSAQLIVKCSVVSLDTDPVELINRFISALKDDPDFFNDFSSFDLGSVQKRTAGNYEVADFAVTLEVKPR
jgi:Tfp pilus assembly protein PilN